MRKYWIRTQPIEGWHYHYWHVRLSQELNFQVRSEITKAVSIGVLERVMDGAAKNCMDGRHEAQGNQEWFREALGRLGEDGEWGWRNVDLTSFEGRCVQILMRGNRRSDRLFDLAS